MKIVLFGGSGMLGRYVYNILKNKYQIICIYRQQYDIEVDELSKIFFILTDASIVINCAGIIPQKEDENNLQKYIKVNTLFPQMLSLYSKILNYKFIHITTDCVFDGLKGSYLSTDKHTSKTNYGITKSLGEPLDSTVIRTSIIGEEQSGKKSLIEWIKSNKNEKINGYINHYWNGVTCLELAKIILQIIDTNNFWKGVKHIYSPDIVSKYDLCCYINEIYDLNIEISSFESNYKNMTLAGSHEFEIKRLYEQIQEQKFFITPTKKEE